MGMAGPLSSPARAGEGDHPKDGGGDNLLMLGRPKGFPSTALRARGGEVQDADQLS